MKALLVSLTMIMSLQSFAEVRHEYDEMTERKCFKEFKALGCVREDKENQECVERNKEKVSLSCHGLIEARKKHNNKSN